MLAQCIQVDATVGVARKCKTSPGHEEIVEPEFVSLWKLVRRLHDVTLLQARSSGK